MGVDYVWSGTASYRRFNRELEEIAKVFGGKSIIGEPWLIFPERTNTILVNWLNQPFDDLTEEETKIVWEEVRQRPEIEEISWQIWNELEKCVEFEDGWYIH